MNRKSRTRILIEGSRGLAEKLCLETEALYPVTVIEPPNEGMVMIKMRETARRHLFYIGELLVTEAKVRVGESLGIGIVAGDEPETAYRLAVIDAAYNGGLALTRSWEGLLREEEERIRGNLRSEGGKIAETRVDFKSMDRV